MVWLKHLKLLCNYCSLKILLTNVKMVTEPLKGKSLGTEKGGIKVKIAFYSITVHRSLSRMVAWESQTPYFHLALLGRWRAGNARPVAATVELR